MAKRLPELISPLRLARSRRSLKGRIPLKHLRRLCSSLYSEAGEAEVELDFGRDEVGILCVRGRIDAWLILTCQRCLEPTEIRAKAEVRLGLVSTDRDAERLKGQYDPLVVDEERISLTDLVEDELILALPEVPMHAKAVCSIASCYAADGGRPSKARDNPFAILETRKNR